tara:strand:+ start:310 stop:1104 length:795 start_codon:yes stop_codon:yes gene_type:complete
MSENGILINHPLDLDTKSLLKNMDKRTGTRDALIKWISTNLIEGTDYAARRGSKKNLEKPGAEKIVSATGLTPEFPSLNKYEESAYSGVDIKEIVIRCELRMHNMVIGTGIGGRLVKEDHGNINKALKMAKKSALIDAVITTYGLTAMFDQDWNEKDQKEQRQREMRANTKQPQAKKPSTLEDMKEQEKKSAKNQTKDELTKNIFKVIDNMKGEQKAQVLDFISRSIGSRVDFDKKTFAADIKKDDLCKLADGIKAILTGKEVI